MKSVRRYYATFKTLAGLANFEPKPVRSAKEEKDEEPAAKTKPGTERETEEHPSTRRRSDFHYNIQIHLPVTTDISVYNAIFKSLKENLGI